MLKPLRPATDRDWRCFYGVEPPVTWSGIVAENQHMIIGIGGLYADAIGRWWAFLKRAPGAGHRVTAQRAALTVLRSAADAGITVHAISDPDIQGSAFWLGRLGFQRDGDLEGYHHWIR